MKKYLLLVLFTFSLLLIGCGEIEPKKSTPSDGLLTNELSVKEMKQDLKIYVEFVKENHADFDNTITEEEFDNEVTVIKSNLENMTSDEFVFELMKLQVKIGDGNTYATLDNERKINRTYLPFEVKKFAEGYLITKIEKTHKDYLGWELKAIDGVSLDNVLTKLSAYCAGDTAIAKKHAALGLVNFYDVLYNAGIVSSKYVQLTLGNGELEVKVSVEAYLNKEYSKVEFAESAADLFSAKKSDYYSYQLVDKALYIQYNYCYDMSSKKMTEFAEELKDYLRVEIHKNAILDLRYNIGGYQETLLPLVSVLRDFKKAGGNVYVLIGNGTKGISIINAMYLYNSDIATIIGEETGGLNNFYGYRKAYTLPNSQLVITVAATYQEYYMNQEAMTLKPGSVVEQTYADYLEGIDSLVKFATK